MGDLNQYIASIIKSKREVLGWSQSDLARSCGITSAAISMIEKGHREPTLSALKKIAKSFGCLVRDLIGESFPKSKDDIKKENIYAKLPNIHILADKDRKLIIELTKRLLVENII